MQVSLAVPMEVPDDLGVGQLAQYFPARLGAAHELLVPGHDLLGLGEVGHVGRPLLLHQALLRLLPLKVSELAMAAVHVSAGAAARQVRPAIAKLALVGHSIGQDVILLFLDD